MTMDSFMTDPIWVPVIVPRRYQPIPVVHRRRLMDACRGLWTAWCRSRRQGWQKRPETTHGDGLRLELQGRPAQVPLEKREGGAGRGMCSGFGVCHGPYLSLGIPPETHARLRRGRRRATRHDEKRHSDEQCGAEPQCEPDDPPRHDPPRISTPCDAVCAPLQ